MPDTLFATRQRLPFWRRQFAPEVTRGQIACDVAAGVLLPIGCLLADPIVFRPRGFLAPFATMAYATIALSILGLTAWLLLRRPAFFLAGAFAAGAALSFLLGILLLPYSLFGLMIILGALGFAPFATAFVYLRNSVRAYELGSTRHDPTVVPHPGTSLMTGVAFFLVLVLPATTVTLVRSEVARVADRAVSSGDLAASVAILQRMRWLVESDTLVWAYQKETAPEWRRRLAELYRSLTGKRIEERLAELTSD